MLIPIPTDEPEEETSHTPASVDESHNQRVREYFDIRPWKCPVCTATMFGRMLYCGYCKMRNSTDTPRPSSFVEMRRDQ